LKAIVERKNIKNTQRLQAQVLKPTIMGLSKSQQHLANITTSIYKFTQEYPLACILFQCICKFYSFVTHRLHGGFFVNLIIS
jgi:hypothetical protein